MFQNMGDPSTAFEFLPQELEEVEARSGVTEYREVVENNPAYLYCDTNAVPPPELTWFKEGQRVSATDGLSLLQGGLSVGSSEPGVLLAVWPRLGGRGAQPLWAWW